MGNYMAELTITITKSELKALLHCTTWSRFYSKFMTSHVKKEILQLSEDEYKRIREFDVEQTRKLYEYFEIKKATA